MTDEEIKLHDEIAVKIIEQCPIMGHGFEWIDENTRYAYKVADSMIRERRNRVI